MSRIRAFDTKPELIVRRHLHSKGLRFRLHDTKLPGKPDIVLPKYRTVLFINGCFWHGHKSCRYFVLPGTRTEWWKQKIENTRIRDRKAMHALKQLGWHPNTVWECQLRRNKVDETLEKVYKSVLNGKF